jgi:uncharacterized membrane protein
MSYQRSILIVLVTFAVFVLTAAIAGTESAGALAATIFFVLLINKPKRPSMTAHH